MDLSANMQTIYSGKYAPDIAINCDEKSDYYGWLYTLPKDGYGLVWVKLVDLKETQFFRELVNDVTICNGK